MRKQTSNKEAVTALSSKEQKMKSVQEANLEGGSSSATQSDDDLDSDEAREQRDKHHKEAKLRKTRPLSPSSHNSIDGLVDPTYSVAHNPFMKAESSQRKDFKFVT